MAAPGPHALPEGQVPGPSAVAERFSLSILRESDVNQIVDAFRIPQSWVPRTPMAGELTPQVRNGGMAIHLDSLRYGLRIPIHPFALEFLRDEVVTPAQLHPHVWGILTGFYVLCRARGVEPTAPLLRYFFRTKTVQHNQEFLALQTMQSRVKLFSDKFTKIDGFEDRWLVVRPSIY